MSAATRYTATAAEHYLHLDGAQVVATDALLRVRDNLADVIEARAMMCVHGNAGLGKTMSVNLSLRQLAAGCTVRVQFRSRPTPRDVRHALFQALALPGEPPGRPIEFDFLLKAALSERPRVLVCDEAQWMSRECFEYWRYLWDDEQTDIAIVFVGGGDCYRVLRREPMLSSRVYVWQEFRRMDPQTVVDTVRVYHRIWADADPELIILADTYAGHGNFRNWARITKHAAAAMARTDQVVPDEKIIEWVFGKLGGRRE